RHALSDGCDLAGRDPGQGFAWPADRSSGRRSAVHYLCARTSWRRTGGCYERETFAARPRVCKCGGFRETCGMSMTPAQALEQWLVTRLPGDAAAWLKDSAQRLRGGGSDKDLYMSVSLVQ